METIEQCKRCKYPKDDCVCRFVKTGEQVGRPLIEILAETEEEVEGTKP